MFWRHTTQGTAKRDGFCSQIGRHGISTCGNSKRNTKMTATEHGFILARALISEFLSTHHCWKRFSTKQHSISVISNSGSLSSTASRRKSWETCLTGGAQSKTPSGETEKPIAGKRNYR